MSYLWDTLYKDLCCSVSVNRDVRQNRFAKSAKTGQRRRKRQTIGGHSRMKKMIMAMALAFFMAVAPLQTFAAQNITTSKASISRHTDVDTYTVQVKSAADGTASVQASGGAMRTFRVFAQGTRSAYIRRHGCAASALTCVLSGYTDKYADYTPEKTSRRLEKEVFGTAAWSSNYRKSMAAQMPVSLNGITKILNYCNVPSQYVRYFKDKQAVRDIKKHLYSGNAVIIEVNNHKQKNGKISSRYNYRWSTSKHTMVLLGMTNNGKAIVADSAYRKWSGKKQRIKFAKVEHLVKFMYSCKRSSDGVYYDSQDTTGGYILVNKK